MSTVDDRREQTRRVVDAVASGVVRIGRHGGRGCGVVVAEGVVVTNAHNLRDRTTQVTFADGRAVQASALGVDADGDLAVLEVDTGEEPTVTWSDEGVELGDVVYSVARTADGIRITDGAVSGVDRAFRGPRGRRITEGVEHTAPLAKGTSGSPVVDGSGKVVGLSTLRLGDGFAIALPANAELRARIDELRAGHAPQRRLIGVALAPAHITRRLRRAVGLPDRDGVLVRVVEQDGPAERAGIRRGDLITAVGGREVASVDDVASAIDSVGEAESVTIHVVRGTEEHDLEVSWG